MNEPYYDCAVIRDHRRDKPMQYINYTLAELLDELKTLAGRTDVISITVYRYEPRAKPLA